MIKYRKKIIIGILAVAFLIACYIFGQVFTRPLVGKDVFYAYAYKGEELKISGLDKQAENMWKVNAGVVDDGTYGKVVLVTPGTLTKAGIIMDDRSRKLTFKCGIHEAAKDASDGAVLKVSIFEEGSKKASYVKEIDLKSNEDFQKVSINLNEYKNKNIYIVFEGEAGANQNEDCDWIILQKAIID